jgi:hypothetical protein
MATRKVHTYKTEREYLRARTFKLIGSGDTVTIGLKPPRSFILEFYGDGIYNELPIDLGV